MRIPVEWFHLYAGDRIHTTLPYHKITHARKRMAKDGWKFQPEPSPRGYWLLCLESPNVSTYKPMPEGPEAA